jgi:hypothetical protein
MPELGRSAFSSAKLEVPGVAGSFTGDIVTRGRALRHLLHHHPGGHPNAGKDPRIEMTKLR